MQRTRAQFEIVALQETDPECPEGAVACSSVLFDTLCVLWNEVESARSNGEYSSITRVKLLTDLLHLANSVKKTSVPFWRTYEPGRGDHYAFIVTTEALFQNLPSANRMPAPRMSRADIGSEYTHVVSEEAILIICTAGGGGPMSPSKWLDTDR